MKKILLLALLAIALLSCNRVPDEGVVKGKTIVTERVLPYKVFGFSWVDYRPTEYYLRLVDQDDNVYFIEVSEWRWDSAHLGDTIRKEFFE